MRGSSARSRVAPLALALLLVTSAGSARVEQPAALYAPGGATPFSPCAEADSGVVSDRLRAVVECYVERGQFAGAILVGRGDDVVMAGGWGAANREWGVANDVDTRFRLGSLTKAFTGVLVMRLVEDGLFELSDPIGRYIPELPETVAERVTIQHLLTHTSGLQEFFRVPTFERVWLYEPPPPVELFRAAAMHPLEFAPGGRYAYRNIGYIGLGVLVEQVTGLSYEQALRRYVLDLAGMGDTGVEGGDEIVERLAGGYARDGPGWRKGSFLNPDVLYAAGGVYSTAADLFRFSRALETGALMRRETRDQMLTPRAKERDDESDRRHYAFGWHIDELRLGERYAPMDIVEHGGDVTSFETLFTRVPALDAVVVILYNHGETDQNAIRDDLLRVLADAG